MKKNLLVRIRHTFLIIASLVLVVFAGASAFANLWQEDPMATILGQEGPLVRISYTAGSKGELYACATCGTNSLGGLARRSMVLKEFQASGTAHFHFSGAEEFLSDLDLMRFDDPKWNPKDPRNFHNEKEKARRLSLGHSMLKVDLGWLSKAESDWFKLYDAKIPEGFVLVEDKPISASYDLPQGRISVVLFPAGKGKHGSPTPEQIQSILDAGKELKTSSSLLIGISPWGNVAEYRFLEQAEGIYSILFGGGSGLGGPYVVDHSSESLLWIRSESHGRAINVLDIMEMPLPGHKASWVEGISFNAKQIFLYLKLPPDPKFDEAIGRSLEEWWKE